MAFESLTERLQNVRSFGLVGQCLVRSTCAIECSHFRFPESYRDRVREVQKCKKNLQYTKTCDMCVCHQTFVLVVSIHMF